MVLHQHNKIFKDAGKLRMRQLSFWSESENSKIRLSAAETICRQIDNMFKQLDKAFYKSVKNNRIPLENMLSIMSEQEKTMSDFAMVVRDHYRFQGDEKIDEMMSSNAISLKITEINSTLIDQLAKKPNDIYQLNSRKFELLVAELLDDMGYEIKVTPSTRDKGRDILAKIDTPLGPLLTIVDCKRYREKRKVGVGIIRNLLWTLENVDKASCAMIVTSSFFSKDSRQIESNYNWKLKLKDFNDIHSWIKNFGKIRKGESGNLWLPNQFT